MDKKKTKTSISIKMKGLEPIITIYKTDGWNDSTHIIGLFYPIRRMMHKINTHRVYKELKQLGITPQECQGCGEGWAEFTIEEPNEPIGTKKKLLVCKSCVYFYDWKRSFKRLYNNPTDWRDDPKKWMDENPVFRKENGKKV